jgi:hypothetical protein
MQMAAFFHKEGSVLSKWISCSDLRLRSLSCSFAPGSIAWSLPSSLQPVLVKRLHTSCMVTITGMAKIQSKLTPSTPTTLSDWLHELNRTEPHNAWILDELQVLGLCQDVATSIKQGTARAVSDGSF